MYDSTDRVTVSQQGAGHLQRQFKYDSLGRLTAVEYRTQSCATWPSIPAYWWFSADSTDYGWQNTCVTSADSTQSYSYDQVGNRTDNVHSYGGNNQVLRFNKWTFTYDADGNLTQKTDTTTGHNWHYGWDAYNRLSWVKESGGDSVHYDYDVRGHLVRRSTNGTINRHWLYVGDQIMGELDGSLYPVLQYVYYPGMDRPYSVMTYNGGSWSEEHELLQDEMGNVVGAIKSGPTVKQLVSYDPWGKATYQVSLSNNGLLWKGLRYEGGAAGLYYVRNRWYDPDVGRFISEDPSGLRGGINLYTFGRNDPVNYADPLGLRSLTQEEMREMGNVCKVLDCSDVNLEDRGYSDSDKNSFQDSFEKADVVTTEPYGSGLTLGNHIWINEYRDADAFVGLLAHELTHVWQNKHGMFGGLRGFAIGLGNLISNLWQDPYSLSGYNSNANFSTYGYEQQAEITKQCTVSAVYCNTPGYPFSPSAVGSW
jgi:RHS repeat-associated protein